MGGNDVPLSLAIHSTAPARDCVELTSALPLMTSGSFSPEPRAPRMSSG